MLRKLRFAGAAVGNSNAGAWGGVHAIQARTKEEAMRAIRELLRRSDPASRCAWWGTAMTPRSVIPGSGG